VSGLPEPSIFDFGPIEVDEKEMNDMKVTDWVGKTTGKRFRQAILPVHDET